MQHLYRNTEFTLSFYPGGYYNTNELKSKQATKTWIIKKGATGVDIRNNSDNTVTFRAVNFKHVPLGTLGLERNKIWNWFLSSALRSNQSSWKNSC